MQKEQWTLDCFQRNILGPKISNDFADDEELRSSHIVFTLHVYQYRIEKANQAGLPGGRLTSEWWKKIILRNMEIEKINIFQMSNLLVDSYYIS